MLISAVCIVEHYHSKVWGW